MNSATQEAVWALPAGALVAEVMTAGTEGDAAAVDASSEAQRQETHAEAAAAACKAASPAAVPAAQVPASAEGEAHAHAPSPSAPASATAPAPAPVPAPAPSRWVQCSDAEGDVWFFDEARTQTVWALPEGGVVVAVERFN